MKAHNIMRSFWETLANAVLGERRHKITAFMVPLLLLAALAGIFLFGGNWLSVDGQGDIEQLIQMVRHTLWAPVAVFVVFTLVGFTGFPQFILMAATVVLFGPWLGFLYAWLGTVISACVGFWVGQFMGADLLRRYGGVRMNWISEQLGRRGLLASAVVRLVPTGPFVMVNLTAGISHIGFPQFVLGTFVGVIPKAALMAFLGASLFEFLASRDPQALVIGALALVIWGVFGHLIWRVFQKAGGKDIKSADPIGERSKQSNAEDGPFVP